LEFPAEGVGADGGTDVFGGAEGVGEASAFLADEEHAVGGEFVGAVGDGFEDGEGVGLEEVEVAGPVFVGGVGLWEGLVFGGGGATGHVNDE
jgi:hypothetical protein